MPRRMVPALAVAIAVLLTGGVAGLAMVDEEKAPAAAPGNGDGAVVDVTPSSTVPGQPGTTAGGEDPLVPPELAGLVAELQAFVEKARGLRFKSPVRVRLLDDKAFRQRIAEESKVDRAEIEKAARVLRALDLLDADVDLEKAQQALLGGAVLGYYDLEKKELYVRGAKVTPAVRQTLVHELVHALQDQHFNVHRPELAKQDDEAEQAFTGLVEGDAVRIERMYTDTMTKRDRDRAREEQESGIGDISKVPPVLIQALTFPYQVGPDFADFVFREGGQQRLDAAFAKPPTTSEHLLHPDKFLKGEGVVPIAEPPANGTVIDKGVFGEFGFYQQLYGRVRDRDVGRAIVGWGGDRYVAWDEAGGRTCVRVDVAMDTPQDAQELRDALQKFVDDYDKAALTGTNPLTLTSCT